MNDMISREAAQSEIDGMLVAEIIRDAQINFREQYPHHVFSLGVGPMQALIGLAIKRGHLALPAAQPAPVTVEGWQPIETAPKDGSLFLATNINPTFQAASVIYWDAGSARVSIDGRWRSSMHDIIGGDRFTHWTPLPAPPRAPTVDIVEWLESQPHEPTDALREAYADYQRRVVQPAPVTVDRGIEVRFTYANDDQEFWVHFKLPDGKVAGLNLGNPKGMIATAALRALAGDKP